MKYQSHFGTIGEWETLPEIHKLSRHITAQHTSGHRAAVGIALDQLLCDVAEVTLLRAGPEHDRLCNSLRQLWETTLDPQSEK